MKTDVNATPSRSIKMAQRAVGGLRRLIARAAAVVPAVAFGGSAAAQQEIQPYDEIQDDVAETLSDRGVSYEFDDADLPLIAPAPPVAEPVESDVVDPMPAPVEPPATDIDETSVPIEPAPGSEGIPLEDPFTSPLTASPAFTSQTDAFTLDPDASSASIADATGGDSNLAFAS